MPNYCLAIRRRMVIQDRIYRANLGGFLVRVLVELGPKLGPLSSGMTAKSGCPTDNCNG
jgi:hypothetical protein